MHAHPDDRWSKEYDHHYHGDDVDLNGNGNENEKENENDDDDDDFYHDHDHDREWKRKSEKKSFLNALQPYSYYEENHLIDLIETMLTNIHQSIHMGLPLPPLVLVHRKDSSVFDAHSQTYRMSDDPMYKMIFAKGKSLKSFAIHVRILEICHDLLLSNCFATKRDIYYQDVNLFGSQRVVDAAIDDIACTLNASRHLLHIEAGSKGLYFGDVKVHLDNLGSEPCAATAQERLIPPCHTIVDIETGASYALIVEKESTFRWIVNDADYLRELIGPFILVTGKGYPCLASRQFVALIAKKYPSMTFYGLFDYDPYGVDIYCTYRYGSQSMSYETISCSVPTLEWIGISQHDIDEYCVQQEDLIPLASSDFRKGLSLIQFFTTIHESSGMKELMSAMMAFGFKVEIQSIQSIDSKIITRSLIPFNILNLESRL